MVPLPNLRFSLHVLLSYFPHSVMDLSCPMDCSEDAPPANLPPMGRPRTDEDMEVEFPSCMTFDGNQSTLNLKRAVGEALEDDIVRVLKEVFLIDQLWRSVPCVGPDTEIDAWDPIQCISYEVKSGAYLDSYADQLWKQTYHTSMNGSSRHYFIVRPKHAVGYQHLNGITVNGVTVTILTFNQRTMKFLP